MLLRSPDFAKNCRHWRRRGLAARAFSLIELLTVVGFMSILVALSVPAVGTLKRGGDFTRAVDSVESALNRARTYAVTQNTYVWVGLHEEAASSLGATTSLPPFAGKGKLVLSIVASVDGTKVFEDDAAPASLPDDRLFPLERLQKFSGVHMADVGSPAGGAEPNRLEGRPSAPYDGEDAVSSRISSEDAAKTPFPFRVGGYIFYKTIRFSPSGEATINGAAIPKRLGEIGFVPTNGDQVANSPDVAAVQFSGMGGNARAYRR